MSQGLLGRGGEMGGGPRGDGGGGVQSAGPAADVLSLNIWFDFFLNKATLVMSTPWSPRYAFVLFKG